MKQEKASKYKPQAIERKWQKKWEASKPYQAEDFSKKPKYYLLIEFPYPSGEWLHVGHGRSYCAFDALARMKRMQGFNVLFPFGWDAFGLPAENYAIRTGIHPAITTRKNIANARKQAKSWGLSFDWSREINTTDPEYYKWTQWIFLQFFKEGLAYKAEVPVNWCPSCKINLANEEVIQGACERCGAATERRMQKQWMLKITTYADRLLNDLKSVDYREDIKKQQIEWIGRSEGARIKFGVISQEPSAKKTPDSRLLTTGYIEVFTTRADTLFGATFLVLAPEHKAISKISAKGGSASGGKNQISKSRWERVQKYIRASLKKSELQRFALGGGKTGVFTGAYAKHPITGEKLPIWISDFILPSYGTGAIMAVPAHDQRDFEFAKKFKLPIKEVIKNEAESKFPEEAFTGEGELANSGEFSGLQSKEAIAKITSHLRAKKLGKPAVDYKLRDWVFSRQHYWGEPIPLVFCQACKKRVESSNFQFPNSKSSRKKSKGELLNPGWIPVPEADLPVKLPYLEKYKPTTTGESPLAAAKDWVEVACPECGETARRETDTMPNWAGSSWYYLAYTFWHKLGKEEAGGKRQEANKNKGNVFRKYRKELDYWMGHSKKDAGRARNASASEAGGVDWYNGGLEHTTLHLLYSRFWYKFLSDLKLVPGTEPYRKRTSHGVVLGSDGAKMSKSRGNVVNPDEVIADFGADTFRIYEMFMGPFDQTIAWDPQGVIGVHRFLAHVWKASEVISQQSVASSDKSLVRKLHQTIKKAEEDLEKLKFNTAIASLMEFLNEVQARINADPSAASLAEENPSGLEPPTRRVEKSADSGRANADRRGLSIKDWKVFLKVLAPFAPYLAEELWSQIGGEWSIHQQPWPKYDPKLIKEETVTVVVQVDGKVRGQIVVSSQGSVVRSQVEKLAKKEENAAKYLAGKKIKKVVFVPGRLINFVMH